MIQERETVSRLIHRSGQLLDQEEFGGYVSLYLKSGEYRLVANAPEVRQPMTWMLMNRDEMSALLLSTTKHVWNTGQRNHLITVEAVDVEGNRAESKSGFCVFHTNGEGATQVYAVGRYNDQWRRADEEWKLERRLVSLQTRALTPPSAIPL